MFFTSFRCRRWPLLRFEKSMAQHGAATTKRPKICLDCMSLQVCKARLFFVIFSGFLSWHSSQSYLAAYPIIIQATHHAAENGREDVEDKVHIDLRGLETLGSMVGSCSLGKPMGHATAKRMERWCWLWDQHNTTKKVWIQWIPDSLRIVTEMNCAGYPQLHDEMFWVQPLIQTMFGPRNIKQRVYNLIWSTLWNPINLVLGDWDEWSSCMG